MSHRHYLYCPQCAAYSEDSINHGVTDWQKIVAERAAIKQIVALSQSVVGVNIDFQIVSYAIPEFIATHGDHGLVIRSEYYRDDAPFQYPDIPISA